MLRILVLALLIASSLVFVGPVQAAAPSRGVVVEGQSVPGVALGDTRSHVIAAYGEPRWCQYEEVSFDQAVCSYPIDGGGSVYVRFRGPDGRYARNAPDDVVYEISWGNGTWWADQPIDWTTTAGINTTIALTDRQAVVDAYPGAVVTIDATGIISRVEDVQLGIGFDWSYDSYTHTTGVHVSINFPQVGPTGEVMTVTDLELTATKQRGKRDILAVVRVLDDLGQPVPGARLTITWTYPSGATDTRVYNFTTETGYDFFQIGDAQRGTWTFTVNDVELDGYLFDGDGSTLSASIRVK